MFELLPKIGKTSSLITIALLLLNIGGLLTGVLANLYLLTMAISLGASGFYNLHMYKQTRQKKMLVVAVIFLVLMLVILGMPLFFYPLMA